VNVGAATIAPDFSPGTLNIFGNLILSSTTTLNFEVGPSSAIYDIINVSGVSCNINFGGATLNLSWFGGYTPTSGDNYQLITFGSNSGNTTLGSITAPVTLTSTYNPTNLLLSFGVASSGGSGNVPNTPGAPNVPTTPGLPPPEAPVIPVFDGNVIQLVVAMWEDAFSQWVNDPLDYNNGFVLTGALNGDNGDRDTGGRGQKIFLDEWDPATGGRGRSGPACNNTTVF